MYNYILYTTVCYRWPEVELFQASSPCHLRGLVGGELSYGMGEGGILVVVAEAAPLVLMCSIVVDGGGRVRERVVESGVV